MSRKDVRDLRDIFFVRQLLRLIEGGEGAYHIVSGQSFIFGYKYQSLGYSVTNISVQRNDGIPLSNVFFQHYIAPASLVCL